MTRETVKLTRDCEATQIPSGVKVRLQESTEVTITQSLGGSYTVLVEDGFLARIGAEDADALGKEVASIGVTGDSNEVTKESVETQVWDRLKTCYDPEIPVNIVELGLIYNCSIKPLEDGFEAFIEMTLTAPGCGMGPTLQLEIEDKIRKIPGIKKAQVMLVWDPPWDQSMMSEAARLQLGFF
ncbi:MAG: putative Fe-S cluster assembly protein SufT [Oligoflexia bacterium]|nr:putative Fe-S cluster assembly protein SufT [Oligoflexia bacterium]